jgi:hypothetical protein
MRYDSQDRSSQKTHPNEKSRQRRSRRFASANFRSDARQAPHRAEQLAETAEHIAELAREFGDQNRVDMNETEATGWRATIEDLKTAATAFRNVTNLIG